MKQPREVKAESGKVKQARYPNTLVSGGLGPCIAIGICDPKNRVGYMMHEESIQSVDLERRIKNISSKCGGLNQLIVYATGSCPEPSFTMEEQESAKCDRSFVESVLKKYFDKKKVTINWMHNDCVAELYLHTATGKFVLEVDNMDYLLQ